MALEVLAIMEASSSLQSRNTELYVVFTNDVEAYKLESVAKKKQPL